MVFLPRSVRRERCSVRQPVRLGMAPLSWKSPLPTSKHSLFFIAAMFLVGCTGGKILPSHLAATGGNAQRGKAVIAEYRCGACHEIPGIRNADGHFGPPLAYIASTTYIAGVIPNNPESLVHWIQSPTSVKPNTTMPALGLSEQQARDVVAYLETLH
jgi:cytochrome c